MDKLDFWKVCTDFTVVQAALIACGVPPEDLQWEVERMDESRCPSGYVAIRTGLKHALESGRLKASKLTQTFSDEGYNRPQVDVHTTTLSAEEIDRFLKSRGIVCTFFERSDVGETGGESERAAMPLKLNAAILAWRAVKSEPARLRGRSPKQALEQWLIEHAAELGLLTRAGAVNRTGIEEICKVANWKPEGGATPTPTAVGQVAAPARRPIIHLPPARENFSEDHDDEIPF